MAARKERRRKLEAAPFCKRARLSKSESPTLRRPPGGDDARRTRRWRCRADGERGAEAADDAGDRLAHRRRRARRPDEGGPGGARRRRRGRRDRKVKKKQEALARQRVQMEAERAAAVGGGKCWSAAFRPAAAGGAWRQQVRNSAQFSAEFSARFSDIVLSRDSTRRSWSRGRRRRRSARRCASPSSRITSRDPTFPHRPPYSHPDTARRGRAPEARGGEVEEERKALIPSSRRRRSASTCGRQRRRRSRCAVPRAIGASDAILAPFSGHALPTTLRTSSKRRSAELLVGQRLTAAGEGEGDGGEKRQAEARWWAARRADEAERRRSWRRRQARFSRQGAAARSGRARDRETHRRER